MVANKPLHGRLCDLPDADSLFRCYFPQRVCVMPRDGTNKMNLLVVVIVLHDVSFEEGSE